MRRKCFAVCAVSALCAVLSACSVSRTGTTVTQRAMIGPYVTETGLMVGVMRETKIHANDDCVNVVIVKGEVDAENLRPLLVDPNACIGELK